MAQEKYIWWVDICLLCETDGLQGKGKDNKEQQGDIVNKSLIVLKRLPLLPVCKQSVGAHSETEENQAGLYSAMSKTTHF